MGVEQVRLTAAGLAELAIASGVSLGTSPVRTIHYYKQMGLLCPEVIQEGSVRRAYYSSDDLARLRYIHQKKRQGLTLQQIKDSLLSPLYLSQAGREYVAEFKSEYPESAFLEGAPMTRGEMAFLLSKLIGRGSSEDALEFLLSLLAGPGNEPISKEDLGIALLDGRS